MTDDAKKRRDNSEVLRKALGFGKYGVYNGSFEMYPVIGFNRCQFQSYENTYIRSLVKVPMNVSEAKSTEALTTASTTIAKTVVTKAIITTPQKVTEETFTEEIQENEPVIVNTTIAQIKNISKMQRQRGETGILCFWLSPSAAKNVLLKKQFQAALNLTLQKN